MTLLCSQCLTTLAFLSFFASFAIAWIRERPVLEVRDGNLFITSADGKNITLQTSGTSYININELNLLHVASLAQNASQLVERWKLGILADIENSLNQLTDSIFNERTGLWNRVNVLESGTDQNSTSATPGRPSGSPIRNPISANDRIARDRITRLTSRVRRTENLITGLLNIIQADECTSNPCQNGGTCEDKVNGYKCLCTEGWEGSQCNTDINECARFDGTDLGCQNGALCQNLPGTYQCNCLNGWHGIHCTKRTMDCNNENSNELCGHGVCVNKPGSLLGYTCICDQGWESFGTNPACIKDIDECAGKHPPCSVNPVVPCINVAGSFHCGGCPHGYTGNGYYCADIDECAINNGGCSTAPFVQCINTMGSRICSSCPVGYQGDGVTCSYVGTCNMNNGGCHPLATCINNPGMSDLIVQCRCPPGYEGNGMGPNGCILSTNISGPSVCSSNPCSHGTCISSGTHTYTCQCESGYTGRNCDILSNPCDPNPCRNQGICRVSTRNRAICRCTSSFSGPWCETPRDSCGGVFSMSEGVLQFPSIGTTYPTSVSCAWVLSTNNVSKVLNVTFTTFNLERSTDCKFDFVQIHDGPTAGEHMIGRYCGDQLPEGGTIITSQDSFYLWFHSDSSITRNGFALHWNSIDPLCGGDIVTDQGAISSPGSPGRYPSDRDCRWHVSVTPGKRIQFHFFTMMLEEHPTCQNDYLEIRDGPSESSRQLGLFCNHTHPLPLVTSGSEAWLHFHSDSSGQDVGFQITFSSIEGSPGCGGVYTDPSGTISSPNFGTNYERNLDCEWKIQIPAGERIKITWMNFKLENSHSCKFDFVEVYDGLNREAPLIGRYCGDTLPLSTLSDSNVLLIRFKSDSSVHDEGFKLSYVVWCGGKFTEETGVIKSPYYPNTYPASRTCIYEIIQAPRKAIKLTFQDMDIESGYSHNCNYDYLEIHDGDSENSTTIGTYCGTNSSTPEFPIMSTHNYMWLKFRTDRSIHRRGFLATYETIDLRCGGLFKTPSGIIQTPSDDGWYSNNENCTWIIQAPPGFVIQLNWLTFDLESDTNCRNDYIQIYENITSNSQQDMGKYCGSTKPPTMTTQSPIVSIKFHTDSSVRADGFMVSYIFIDASKVCGGHFHTLTGVITSPNYPEPYPENKVCIWVIDAPNKHQIVLNVKNFSIEAQSSCVFDYLEIRNGGYETSPLIGKYCGTDIPTQIASFGNQMYLKFSADFSRGNSGFNIEWDSTTIGCGGVSTTTSGSISSPNYPQQYSHSAECHWNIRVSAGSIIQFVIIDLQLEDHAICEYDFIEIYEGLDRHGKKLGRYCGRNHPIFIQTTSNVATIRFRSDVSMAGRGFLINYQTLCHNKLRGFGGVIESPNFPNNYPHRENCSWIIEAPPGNKINITFSHFDLEAGDDDSCPYDYLEVKEGDHDIPNREIAKYCDSMVLPPKIVSTQRQVFLQFYSDSFVANNGFRLEWVVNGCGGILTRPQGIITSPGYPGPYPPNLECDWYIEVDYFHSIEITLVDVNLEKTQSCSFDKIAVYSGADETAPKLIETCHTDHPVVLTSTSHTMFIKFEADHSFQSSGFKATYKSVDIQCGGKFTAATGRIHSANYPSNYPTNQNCEWLIQVPVHHLVNLTFVDFDIENTRNCTDDYVRIYDGSTRNATVLGSHCHNILPPSYISSSNELLVVMRTDAHVSAKGFEATYDMACGARIVTNDQGIISMNSVVGLHTSITNCTWIIVAQEPEDHVTLTFTDMQLSQINLMFDDCRANHLQILEGEGTDGPSLGTWCGTKVPQPITSQGNALTISVTSLYADLYKAKFVATYSVIDSACGGNYTSEHGTIATPGYPNSYPRNIECIWYFQTSAGNSISLSFKEFDLDQSENCDLDYVEVREENGIGKLIGVYCGTDVNTINSQKNLWVKFKSSTATMKKGFLADYSLLHGNELSEPSGKIASPLYPKPCTLEGEFFWRITVDYRFSIQITFEDFHIELFNEDCYIYLTIYDGYDEHAPELMSKCGLALPEQVRSSSNVVYIKFFTSTIREGNWFLLSWLQIPREYGRDKVLLSKDCNEIISLGDPRNNTYRFNSPGWPNGYSNRLDCSWIFESIQGTHLDLKFNVLDLQQTEGCIADQVEVFTGNSLTSQREWSQIGTYCYPNATQTHIEASNLMKIDFHTNSYLNKTGFQATVRKYCGGELLGPNGVIEINSTITVSSSGIWRLIECQWIVTVRPGKTIEVKFINFNIPNTSGSTCSDHYLMLKNGGSTSSPLLGDGKYCGSDIPGSLQTTGNQLYVKILGLRSTAKLKITYREVGMNCGGEILLTQATPSWELSSPNYPNIPSPYSECFWRILAPAGEQIRINFVERFDLTRSRSCDNEYLEIRDGGTELSSLIGQYCGSEPPSTITTTGNIMYLHFYTDVDDPKNGFKAVVNIGNQCGGILTGKQGVLRSPNYPASYPTNITCTWHIVGPSSHTIKLQFQHLDLPSRIFCQDVDYVNISEQVHYNESSVSRDLGKFCGRTEPGLIKTSGNEVTVIFTSDNKPSNDFKGFSINFTSSTESCGGELTGTGGEFSSPGYPEIKFQFRHCEWKITVPDGYRVRLEILDFDLAGSVTQSAMLGSRLLIYNDFYLKSRIEFIRANNTKREFYSTSNTMLIWYWSDSVAHRGFKARYSSSAPALCGGLLTSEQGTLIYAQDSIFNLNSFYCNWKIYSPMINSTSQTLAVNLTGVIGSTSTYHVKCRYHPSLFQITAGTRIIADVCGNLTSGIIVRSPAPTNTITVFTNNKWIMQNSSFTASYHWHQCGGILPGPSHTISAPRNLIYPVDCVWNAKFSENNKVIKLSFQKLNLGGCTSNYIIIRNGGPTSPVIDKYCGSLIPPNITSQSNELWIEYHAEDLNNEFKIQLDVIQSGCGGKLHGRSSDLFTPGFPKQYPNNAECTWDIMVENGYHIGLVFVDRFNLETSANCTNDFVQIFDWKENTNNGTYSWSEQGKICGRNAPNVFNSTSNQMLVLFRSNNAIQADGFHAKWNVNCGGTVMVSAETRYLTSPGWPRSYKGNLFCNYTFLAPQQNFIIEFTQFQLEGSMAQNCKYDNVSIVTTKNRGDAQTWCGTSPPPIQRVNSRLEILFKTDRYVQRKGFEIKYHLDYCGGIITRPENIQSPSLEGSDTYYGGINCTWIVTAPPEKAIILKFESFHLEYSRQYDYVAAYSGLTIKKENRLALLCGSLNESLVVIRSDNGSMTINFVTDNSRHYGGFTAKILFTTGVAAGCGGEIQLSHSQPFRTQNSPMYAPLEDCHWLISAPRGEVIRLRITNMDLKNATFVSNRNQVQSCTGDYLEVRDGLGPLSDLIQRYCGNVNPPPIISSSNNMWIRLVTDGTLNGNGVIGTLETISSPCGNSTLIVTNETRVLTSPDFPTMYAAGLWCRWTLKFSNLARGYWENINIHFKQFDLEDSENCNEEKLSIVDKNFRTYISEGFGRDFVLSGTHERPRDIWRGNYLPEATYSYCGNNLPNDYYSSTGEVEITFKSSPNRKTHHTGFKLEYSKSMCNRNFTGAQGRIVHQHLIDCWFTISAPIGYTISLYFNSIAMLRTQNCTNNALEVHEGDFNGTTLAVLCGYTIPNPVFSSGNKLSLHSFARNYTFYQNYDITYTTTDKGRGCGGKLYNYKGQFTSPLYPRPFRNVSECTWEVSVPAGFIVQLVFHVFDIGIRETCETDFLQISDIQSDGETLLANTYCGGDNPAKYHSTSNKVMVKYATSMNNGGTGWSVIFSAQRSGN